MALRLHAAAGLIAIGPALMAVYMMPQYVLGGHYLTEAGNNEDFFLLHLGLFILAAAVGGLAWVSFDAGRLPPTSASFRRWTGLLMLAVAVFLLLRYLPALADIWADQPPAEYVDDPITFWLIAFMDLGIVMPVAIATGIALLSGVEAARKPMYVVVAWFALVGPAVAAMSFAMEFRDDPHASLAGAISFAAFGVIFAAVALVLFRPAFRHPSGGD